MSFIKQAQIHNFIHNMLNLLLVSFVKKRFHKENLKEDIIIPSNFKCVYIITQLYVIGYTQTIVWLFHTKLFECLLSIAHIFTTFASSLTLSDFTLLRFFFIYFFPTFLFNIRLYFSSSPILIVIFRCFIRYLHINILSLVRFQSAFLLF